MPTLTITNQQMVAALTKLKVAGFLDKAFFSAIGEALMISTAERFDREEAPDGTPWEPLSPKYRQRKMRIFGEDKILRLRGYLRDTIRYQASDTELRLGSNRVYAALHQFGGHFRAFGTHDAAMPARPYLGLSNEDQQEILDTVQDAFTAMTP